MNAGVDVGIIRLSIIAESFTFSVKWLHGAGVHGCWPRNRFGSGLSCCTLGCYCLSVSSSSLFLLAQTFLQPFWPLAWHSASYQKYQ
jgi:hypothetical protein